MSSHFDATITHIISGYVPTEEGTHPVDISITGDAWSVQKTVEVIRASQQMYNALHDALVFLASPDFDDVAAANQIDLTIHRAIAAARGGVLMQDRLAKRE